MTNSVCDLPSKTGIDFALPYEVNAEFAFSTDSPRAARRLVGNTLRGWNCFEFIDDVSLVTTELATNVIKHGRSGFALSVERQRDGVRVQVRDASSSLPRIKSIRPTSIGGRGLRLVDSVASDWGIDHCEPGKIVWAWFSMPRR